MMKKFNILFLTYNMMCTTIMQNFKLTFDLCMEKNTNYAKW